MSTVVSDVSGNRNDKIVNAAKVLGRAEQRKKVFIAVYTGKKKIKRVSEIAALAGLERKRVLEEAKKLVSEDLVEQLEEKIDGETAYRKLAFYSHNKNKIINLYKNKNFEKFPTKTNPQINLSTIKLSFPKRFAKTKQVHIDDIVSFSKVRRVKENKTQNIPFYEKQFKSGIQKILGEKGKFTDWGGERNDLFSTRFRLNDKRINVAFAFKGKGFKGILTPKMMGKNGDQIQRLFTSPAEVFIVQYHGQISESVIEQMKSFAMNKSIADGRTIYYGVIDGTDTRRLIAAYPKAFR